MAVLQHSSINVMSIWSYTIKKITHKAYKERKHCHNRTTELERGINSRGEIENKGRVIESHTQNIMTREPQFSAI